MSKQVDGQGYGNRVYCGFKDKTRSQTLLKHLKFLETHPPSYDGFKPTFCQTASKVHALGVVMVPTYMVLTLGTIAGAIVFSGFPLHQTTIAILIGTIGGSGSLVAFGLAIYGLSSRKYWKDPAFCQRRAEGLMQDLITNGYDAVWSKLQPKVGQPELLSKDLIKKIIDEEFFAGKSYEEIQRDPKNNISQLFKYKIFHQDDFTCQLLQESAHLTFVAFLEKYGWQPFVDRLVFADSTVARQLTALPDCSESEYSEFLDTSFSSAGDSPTISFRERFLEDLGQIESWSDVFGAFRDFWNLFDYKIAEGVDFHDRAIVAFEEQGFKRMIGQYRWNLLDKGIVAADEVHEHACQDFEKLGFETMISTCSWNVFAYVVVSNKDIQVTKSFKFYLRNEQRFSNFYHRYYSQALNRGIIPERWRKEIGRFAGKYGDALSTQSRKIEEANRACESAISTAESNKRAALAPLRSQVSSAQSQLDYTSRTLTTYVASSSHSLSHGHGFAHGHSYGRHHGGSSMTTVQTRNPAYDMAQTNLCNAESALSSARSIQEGIFQRAKTDAKSTRDDKKSKAERVLGLARDQIDGEWRTYIATV